MTSLLWGWDFKKTIYIIENSLPQSKHLFIVSGTSMSDQKLRNLASAALTNYDGRLNVEYLSGLAVESLLEKVAQLPENSAIFYLTIFRDANGKTFVPREIMSVISEKANAPVFGIVDTYLGHGTVGGYLLSAEHQGKRYANIAVDIMRGEPIKDAEFMEKGNLPMFDWQQLKRWSIEEDTLPPGSIVRYKNLTIWDLYRWYIISGIFLLLFQAFIIIGLFIQRKRRKQFENALQQSKEFSTSILMSLQDHIAVLDREGTILVVNESWMKFAHQDETVSPDHIGPGVNYLEVCRKSSDMGDTTARSAMDGIRSVVEGSRKFFSLEYRCDSPTEKSWFHMSVFPFKGHKGGIIVAHSDVTARKQAEEKAKKRREELIHMGRITLLGELSASIAHELNQPLTGILSNAQAGEMLLKQGDGNSAEIEEILTDIISDGKRSGDILRNLRVLFSKQRTEFEPLNVNKTTQETLRILHSEFVIQDLTIHQDLTDTLPDVLGNKVQLQQVLINLFRNASQAMQQSAKEHRSISVITSRGNEIEVQVQVEDTGPGIDPEKLESIFDSLSTLKPDGMGMGLSISRSIVQTHGGRIWAENKPSGGARISFTLPAAEKKS
jgi:nitrogen-specific signal transduction histidine kinase